jgi:hypothetical protein
MQVSNDCGREITRVHEHSEAPNDQNEAIVNRPLQQLKLLSPPNVERNSKTGVESYVIVVLPWK